MQQRRLRLGDILDDYCPRERRITNHAVVAMIDDEVKRTRCTTCDTEHEYKEARVPAPRRRKPAAALAGDVPEAARPRVASRVEPAEDADIDPPEPPAIAELAQFDTPPDPAPELDAEPPAVDDDGPVHRPLIRATLPRPEGQAPERERKEPEFTFRHQGGRGFDGNRNGLRQRGPRGARQAQGQHQQQGRFGQPRHGSGQSHRQGAGQSPRHGAGQGNAQGQRHGNRTGEEGSRGGRPAGHGRGPRPPGQGRGPKRGR